MIAIINSGLRDDEGRHLYRIQINEVVVGRFAHSRADGLACCLQIAADTMAAVESEKLDRIAERLRAECRTITEPRK